MEPANTTRMGTNMEGSRSKEQKHCNGVKKKSLKGNFSEGQADVLRQTSKWDNPPSKSCGLKKYGLNERQDLLPSTQWSVGSEQRHKRVDTNRDDNTPKYNGILNAKTKANDSRIWKSSDMSCTSHHGKDRSAKGKIKTKIKLVNRNHSASKLVQRERQQSNGFGKYDKHSSNVRSWKYLSLGIKNEACSLFEEQLQELESQTADKCLKLKFRRKKIKSTEFKTVSLDKKWQTLSSSDTSLTLNRTEQKSPRAHKHIHSQIKTEKHFHNERNGLDKKTHKERLTKKKHSNHSSEKSIAPEKSPKDNTDKIKDSENKTEKVEIAESTKDSTSKSISSEVNDKANHSHEKNINCQNRCYRLQSAQWKGSTKCVLRLLKRKYRSVRILFSKSPVIALERLNEKKVKMIGDNFEVISMWEAETDSSVYAEDGESDKDVTSEGGNLVDPRVMSLSRTLESGLNGKVGAEKTFKNLSGKTSRSKTQVCLKLEAIKSATKKPLAQKPDWSKLKQKLKEVNEKQVLQRKKDGVIVGRDIKRIPVSTGYPFKGYRDSAKQTKLESNKSITEKTAQGSESIIQERKKELEKLCTGSEPDVDAVEFIEDNDDILPSGNTLEEFEELPSDTEIELDSNYKIGDYSIEICRDSADEGQSLDCIEDSEQFSAGEIKGETVDNRETSPVDGTRLTVTSGIIPNLYISDGQTTPDADERSRSPPILIREFEQDNVCVEEQGIYYIKEASSPSEMASDENEENNTCKQKLDDSQNELSSSSNAIDNGVGTGNKNNDPFVLQIQNVCTLKNAQYINSKDTSGPSVLSDNVSSLDNHFTSTPNKQFLKDISPESDLSHSTLSSITDALLSDSAETLNYSELLDDLVESSDNTSTEVFIDTGEADKSGIDNEDASAAANDNDKGSDLKRSFSLASLSSTSSGEDTVNPEMETFDTQPMYSNNSQGSFNYNKNQSGRFDKDKQSRICDDNKQSNSGQSILHLESANKAEVKTSQPDLTLEVHTQSPLRRVISYEGIPVKKTSENLDKEKIGKYTKKRKKSLEKTYMHENDAEDLPKITPPKRRPRAVSCSTVKSTEDHSQQRLMQDFPKHNWLFNKYSFGSNDGKSKAELVGSRETDDVSGVSTNRSLDRSVSRTQDNMMEQNFTRPVEGKMTGYSPAFKSQTSTPTTPTILSVTTSSSAEKSSSRARLLESRTSSVSISTALISSTSPLMTSLTESVKTSSRSRNISKSLIYSSESMKTSSNSRTPSMSATALANASSPSVGFSTISMNTTSSPRNIPPYVTSSTESMKTSSSLLRNIPITSLSSPMVQCDIYSSIHQNIPQMGIHNSQSSSMKDCSQSTAWNQHLSQKGLPGSQLGGVGESDSNKGRKIDELKTNEKNALIHLNYRSHITQCSTGKEDDKVMDQSPSRALHAYQSLQTQEGDTSVTQSCYKTDNADVIKSGVASEDLNPSNNSEISQDVRNVTDCVKNSHNAMGYDNHSHNAKDYKEHSQNAMEVTCVSSMKTGSGQGLMADIASVKVDFVTENQTTNKTGSKPHSCQDVVTMVTEKVGLVGSNMEDVDSKSYIQSKESGVSDLMVSKRVTQESFPDLLESGQQCGRMASSDQYPGKPSTVESSGLSFRPKPSPPVLRVQPHLYKPPGRSKDASPEPQSASAGTEVSTDDVQLPVSTVTSEAPISSSSSLRTSTVTQGEVQNVDQQSSIDIAQRISSVSTALVSNSQTDIGIHTRPSPCESRKSKTAEVVPIPSVPLGALSNTWNSSNTGMVNPVQPIIQTLGIASHTGNVQHGQSNPSTGQPIPTTNHILTSQASDGGRRALLPRSILPFNGTPFLGPTQVNTSYLYHQPPASIQVQSPAINPTQLYEINPISQITQLPQTNQVFLLDSGNSVIPISTGSTTIAQNPGQQVFSQDQLHLGQIISGGRIIIAQPLGGGTGTTENSRTVETVPEVTSDVNKMVHTLATEQGNQDGSSVTRPTDVCKGDNVEHPDVKDNTKKEQEVAKDDSVALSDEDDEEFTRQMEEIDKEIQRKEKEREEMRMRKLELLQKRKATKCVTKMKNEDIPGENVKEDVTDLNQTSDKLVKVEHEISEKAGDIDQVAASTVQPNSNSITRSESHENADVQTTNEEHINDASNCAIFSLDNDPSGGDDDPSGGGKEFEGQEESESIEKEQNPDKNINEENVHEEKEDDDQDDQDEEDAFEGALVIDLSASSKDVDNARPSTKTVVTSATRLIVEEEIKDEREDETYIKPNENTNKENVVKNVPSGNEMHNVMLQGLDSDVSNHSIEYIPDIHRINPFTGEYEPFETSNITDGSFDLSNKCKNNSVESDLNEKDERIKKKIDPSLAIAKSIHEDKTHERDDNAKDNEDNISDVHTNSSDRLESTDNSDMDTLDLSAKPVCVFTFKADKEATGDSQGFSPRNVSNTPNELTLSSAEVNDQNDCMNDNQTEVLNDDSDEKRIDVSTASQVSNSNQLESKQTGVITENVAICALSALKEQIDQEFKKSDDNENTSNKEGNLSIRQQSPSSESVDISVLSEHEQTKLNEKEEYASKSLEKETKDSLPNETSVMNLSLRTNIDLNEISKSGKLESPHTSIVTNTNIVQVSESYHQTTTVSTRGRSLVTSSDVQSPLRDRGPPFPRGAYRPRLGQPPGHSQQPLVYSGHQGPRMYAPPPNQQRFPGMVPQGFLGPHGDVRPRFPGQHDTMRLQQPHRNTDIPFQNQFTNPIQHHNPYNARIDPSRGRMQANVHQQQRKQTRGMYVEIEQAHYKPPPKKIPKGAKPAEAHSHNVNMKEIFKKMNKSHCTIPAAIQQSGPYFKRKQPVYHSPDTMEGLIRKDCMEDKPNPAHCQRPFSIAGQLIVSRKRPYPREYESPSPTRFSSVPNTPPSPLEEIERPFSAKPDIPLETGETQKEFALQSLKSDNEHLTSPIRAHSNIGSLTGNQAISTVQVLKPPTWCNGRTDTLHGNNEIIDLTQMASPKVEIIDEPNITRSQTQMNTETILQNELETAVSAKRQRLDMCAGPTRKQGSCNNEVMNAVPPVAGPPYHASRMQAPLNKPMRVRQPDYSLPPRQISPSVPVHKQMPPSSSVPYPLVQQALFSDQGNPLPVKTHPLHEQSSGNQGNMNQGHHSSQQGHVQLPPPLVSMHDQRPAMGFNNQDVYMGGMGRPSVPNSMDLMNIRNPAYQASAGMYQPGAERSQRRQYTGQQHNVMQGPRLQPHSDRLQHQFMPPQDVGQGRQMPHLLQHHPQGHMMSPGNPMMSHSNQRISPSNPMMSHSNQRISPSNPMMSHSNQRISPNNSMRAPNNPMMSPSNQMMALNNQMMGPNSSMPGNLPPSPRGDVSQNWSQIQKMQQIRAHHLRSRQLQNRQQTGQMGPRPGFLNAGHPGMTDNFNQDSPQGHQLSPKQSSIGLSSLRSAPYQGREQVKQPLPYPVPNQSFHPQQMTHPGKLMPAAQMNPQPRNQQLTPPSSNRYYHVGSPEDQFVSHHKQFPPSLTQVQGAHNRSNFVQNLPAQPQAHNRGNLVQGNLQAPLNREQVQGYNPGYSGPSLGFHGAPVRNCTQATYHGAGPQAQQPSPGTTYPTTNPSQHHPGQGQTQGQGNGAQRLQPPMRGPNKLRQVPEKMSPGMEEEENMPHLQQVHGSCILCNKYSLYLCSSCKKIWYCSPECQLKHWQTHVNECKGPTG